MTGERMSSFIPSESNQKLTFRDVTLKIRDHEKPQNAKSTRYIIFWWEIPDKTLVNTVIKAHTSEQKSTSPCWTHNWQRPLPSRQEIMLPPQDPVPLSPSSLLSPSVSCDFPSFSIALVLLSSYSFDLSTTFISFFLLHMPVLSLFFHFLI